LCPLLFLGLVSFCSFPSPVWMCFPVFSSRTHNSLAVFSCISLSELLKSFLMSSTIIMRYAFQSGSSFSGVLGYPVLAEEGVLGSDDSESSCFLLVRFWLAFSHMAISRVSCYSCLWLELVSPVILLASISRPGRLTVSWVSLVRVLSAGKLSTCREGAEISGLRTCLLAEDEGLKQGLSQKPCSFCSLHSHLHSLVVSERSWIRDGSLRSSVKTFLGWMDTSPLAGTVCRCLEPETGSAPEALPPLQVPEAVSFCSPHSYLWRPVSEGSGNQDGSGKQDGSPRCSSKALLGGADTSPLAGVVPACLEPETGSSPEAVWPPPVLIHSFQLDRPSSFLPFSNNASNHEYIIGLNHN
jgi:hypothetical protein